MKQVLDNFRLLELIDLSEIVLALEFKVGMIVSETGKTNCTRRLTIVKLFLRKKDTSPEEFGTAKLAKVLIDKYLSLTSFFFDNWKFFNLFQIKL